MDMDNSVQVSLTILPKISGLLSLIGSGWIIIEVFSDRKKLAMVYHRLLLGMSTSDLFFSIFWFMSSWCVPRGTWWGAAGNERTCTLQGFFLQIGIATALYNASLSIYYLLVIREGWAEGRIRATVEPWLHCAAISISLGTAVAGVPLGLYKQTGPICSMAYAGVYEYVFAVAWWGSSLVVATACMVAMYVSIRRTETAMGRYGARRITRKRSREFANQAMLYLAAFYLTYTFNIIDLIVQTVTQSFPPLAIGCLAAFFHPLQGFLNFLVYVRPRYIKYRKEFSSLSAWQVVGLVLRRPFRHCLEDGNEEDEDEQLGARVQPQE